MGIYTRERTKHLNVITAICIFSFINTLCVAFSQPSTAEGILQLGKFSAAYNAGDEGGNWGNFLQDESCEGPFRDYLYAMGIRENETGQMYLNSTQQTNCLTKMNDEGNGIDVFGCGIEKITKVGGGCSDFSVNDVNMKLGNKLRSLSYNCQFQDTADKRSHLSESCVNSWKDIKEMNSEIDKYTEVESDICRFAVLVSLTSTRITDQLWLRKLYNCLSNQQQPVNSSHTEGKEQEAEEHSELTEKHKFRPARDPAIPKDSSLKIPIEEVYSATNNLNESNFIGEGTADYYPGPKGFEIAIDSAKGLLFLHTYHDGSIIHHDIKPTNILLGKNFEAKLSDFGLSKVIDIDESYMISEVRGTYGYVDPEYETNHRVNSAGDVYRFGIVLLQILPGREVINMIMEQPTWLEKIENNYLSSRIYHSLLVEYYTNVAKYLSFQAKALIRERRAIEYVDPKLHGDYSTETFELTLELAISCIAPKQQKPSIEKVVDKLEKALAITRRAKASTPHSTPVWFSTSF
ncbi:hypothetical protein HAX54_014912 [Datura stramonium]|uniref:Protein kinase domain-containing protein n=1 Tax=Datura stramonium TaxID=4076 RepID=A0ABS8RZ94_DATST|nr:hypothetical protein [Datura stramonium]